MSHRNIFRHFIKMEFPQGELDAASLRLLRVFQTRKFFREGLLFLALRCAIILYDVEQTRSRTYSRSCRHPVGLLAR